MGFHAAHLGWYDLLKAEFAPASAGRRVKGSERLIEHQTEPLHLPPKTGWETECIARWQSPKPATRVWLCS